MNTAISSGRSAGLRPAVINVLPASRRQIKSVDAKRGTSPSSALQDCRQDAGSTFFRAHLESSSQHIEAQDFARLAIDNHLKRTAADFAIRRETLRRDAGVDDQLEALAAERALDGFSDLHQRYRIERASRFMTQRERTLRMINGTMWKSSLPWRAAREVAQTDSLLCRGLAARRAADRTNAADHFNGLPIDNRRHSRVPLCATTGGFRPPDFPSCVHSIG